MGEVSLAGRQRLGLFRSGPGYTLGALLVVLLLATVASPRDPSRLTATELTFLAAGQSVAHDLDLRFDDPDRKRLGELSRSSEDLLLESRDVSAGPEYDLPRVYPILLAPFVRLSPTRGPAVLNAILLVLTVAVAAHRVGQRLGQAAVAMISVCVFASVTYRSVFLISPTLLLTACVAMAIQLALSHEEPASHGMQEVYRPPDSPVGVGGRGLAIGLLLGVVAIHHPTYLLLAVPAAVAVPAGHRRTGLVGLGLGLSTVLTVAGLAEVLGGFSAFDLAARVKQGFELSVGLTAWNLLYFAIGRNVGLVPYFLPLVALLGLWKGGSGRSILVLTAIGGGLAALLVAPFNFFDGPAAVGNSWLVPWFVLLWFVPTQPLPRGWVLATVLLAVPGMYPTWLAPDGEPVTDHGVYRHASGRLQSYLPLETTQEALPPGEVMGDRFWIRSTSREARVGGSNRWLLEGEGWAELQLATPIELAAVHLQFGPQAEAELEVRGAQLGDTVLLPDGGVGFRLEELSRPKRHPMWWSRERHFNYVLRFRMPMEEARAQTMTVTAIATDLERAMP